VAEPSDSPSDLARLLAAHAGLPTQLLAVHRDDGTGHCRLCSGGGQTGRYTHPCTIRAAATAALALQGRGRRDGGSRPPDRPS
jgi:hypothetical protein